MNSKYKISDVVKFTSIGGGIIYGVITEETKKFSCYGDLFFRYRIFAVKEDYFIDEADIVCKMVKEGSK